MVEAAHARTLANALRAASTDSVAESRSVVAELRSFLDSHQLDSSEHEAVQRRVEQIERRLESKAGGLHHTEELDEEWQAELTALSDRIEGLYARASN